MAIRKRRQVTVLFDEVDYNKIVAIGKEKDLPLSSIVRHFCKAGLENNILGLQGKVKRDVIFYSKLYDLPVAVCLRQLLEIGLLHHNTWLEFKVKAKKMLSSKQDG